MLRVFRGISVASEGADDLAAQISAAGLTTDGPRRRVEAWPVRNPKAVLADGPASIDAKPGDPLPAICAADELGALHYACRHNLSANECVPLLIEFDVNARDVCVDGNDLLYRLFSRHARVEQARVALAACYGEAILDYAERAWLSHDPLLRIALCDLAVWDPEVVAAHHSNRLVIGGKHRTLFRSAFKVVLPIPATAIVSVQRIDDCPPAPRPEVSLDALTL